MRFKNNALEDQLKALVRAGDLPAPAPASRVLPPRKPTKQASGQGQAAPKQGQPNKPSPKPRATHQAPRTPQPSPPRYNGPLVRPQRPKAATAPTSSIAPTVAFAVKGGGEFANQGFRWAKQSSRSQAFVFNYASGDAFQTAPNGQESLSEVVLGVDFGTSGTKVIFRDTDRQTAYAIRFRKDDGKDTQILPTAIYESGDIFTLQGVSKRLDDIKIRSLKSQTDDHSLSSAVAYLALVIRYARSYVLTRYKSAFNKRDLLWRFHFGIPAADVRHFPVQTRYMRIARAAVLCSVGTDDFITRTACIEALDRCTDNQTIHETFNSFPRQLAHACDGSADFFCSDAVKIWPEVMAQTHGFLRSNLWNPQTMDRIMTIDVGAGTLDVSLCQISSPVDGDTDFAFTPLCVSVDGLGIRNFVKNRISKVIQATADAVLRENIEAHEAALNNINWVTVRVPTPLMGSGGFFEGLQTIGNADQLDTDFVTQIGKMVWTNSAKPAFSDRAYEERPVLPVFLCGGGKFLDFYRDHIRHYQWINGVVRFSLQDIRSPEELIDSDDELFDRISVAYGLAFTDLGRFLDDGFGDPHRSAPFSVPQIRAGWADKFVDKDMV